MYEVTIKPEWIIRQPGGESLPRRVIELLVKVHEAGTLAGACKATGLSYRYAWELLHQGEALFGEALIVMERGKGSKLTVLGEKLVWAEKRIAARLSPVLDSLASELSAEIEKARSPSPDLLRIHASHGFSIQLLHNFLNAGNVANELKYLSSTESVVSLHKGECDIAGFHVPIGEFEPAVLAHYDQWLRSRSLKVISIVTRRQGLMVAPGNPKEIFRIADLTRPDVHFVNRQPGSGTRLLLDLVLRKEGVAPASIRGYEQCEYTHAAVAAFVASGMADAGYGVETPARRFKLDFIPTQTERYCLVCNEKSLATPAMKQTLAILRSTKYRNAVNALPGYKVRRAGVVMDFREVFAPGAGGDSTAARKSTPRKGASSTRSATAARASRR